MSTDICELATKVDLKAAIEALKAEMLKMELRLQQFVLKIATILGGILGSMMVAGFSILVAIKYFG